MGIYTSLRIAGPGDLAVSAGRNLYQGNNGSIASTRPLVDVNPNSRGGGANMTLLAGRNSHSSVQVPGHGELTDSEKRLLSEDEQQRL